MASLTFDGVIPEAQAMRYKGGLSGEYLIDIEGAAATFKFTHGDFIRCRKGPNANRGVLVVIGTTGSSEATRLLVLHDEAAGSAFIVTGCHTYLAFADAHDPEPIPAGSARQHGVNVTGQLGFRYNFNTDVTTLEERFGVTAGTKLYFGTLGCTATVVGLFLNVLWATPEREAHAVPLVGGTNESALLTLHGMRDADARTGAVSPRTPRTPGRSRGAAALPYTVDHGRGTAVCVSAFNAKVEVATDSTSLKPFGVTHGQRLFATRGLEEGKTFVVIGVKAGNLYVHIEGDKRVTSCRNCADAADLDAMYGFGLKTAKTAASAAGAGAAKGSSEQRASPLRAADVFSSNDKSRSRDASPARASRGGGNSGAAAEASPRSTPGADPRPCWTATGRVYFDTSAKALDHFGFRHGQLVEATTGGERGQRFAIFGVRHGVLWAVPEGQTIATGFRHCTDRRSLTAAHGLRVVGTSPSMEALYAAGEPPKTPLHSPRGRADSAPMSQSPYTRGASAERGSSNEMRQPTFNQPPQQPYDSPVRDPPSSQQQQQQRSAGNVVVPSLPLGTLAGAAGRRNADDDRSGSSYRVAPETMSSTMPEVGHSTQLDQPSSSYEPDDADADFTPGEMPATRLYLKAFAHFKLGQRNAQADPTAFHAYYSEDPHRRLSAAMASLPTFASHWRQVEAPRRGSRFAKASVDELLDAMRGAAHLMN